MAEHLARIIGTEEDRVNCPFYWKIGACRHGDQCSRNHYKPSSSPTLIIRHIYENSPVALAIAEGQEVNDKLADEESDKVEAFYGEMFSELSKYGEICELLICDNIGDHMMGNVYVRYSSEEYARSALINLRNKGYMGKQVKTELSPVSDFKEAKCRQYIDGCCNRGGYCNFMHIKHVPRCVKDKFFSEMYSKYPEYLTKREGHRGEDSLGFGVESGKDHKKNGYRRDDCHYKERNCDEIYSRPRKTQRQSSEERRMMIESWNKQREK
ncbi:U2 snRNP auxiliary factor [Cryptosporidium xiaoi]|uniref:U2 snRNP auxiliary factor n=1 Tax=Cryptosporidium xiaoi TaxID=659607 RepID=A0AAV9XUF9_9CRYT